MTTSPLTLNVPDDLKLRLDAAIRPENRDAFFTQTMERALERLSVFQEFLTMGPIWRDEDHPDLASLGTVGWLKKMREPEDKALRALHEEGPPAAE